MFLWNLPEIICCWNNGGLSTFFIYDSSTASALFCRSESIGSWNQEGNTGIIPHSCTARSQFALLKYIHRVAKSLLPQLCMAHRISIGICYCFSACEIFCNYFFGSANFEAILLFGNNHKI